jgi:hypothetical protein
MLHSEDAVALLMQALPASRASQVQLMATTQALGLSSDARALAPLLTTAADMAIPDLSRASALAALGILAEKDTEPVLQALRRGASYAAANGALAALLRVQ